MQGASLAQLASALDTYNINVKMYFGKSNTMNEQRFRQLAMSAVSSNHKFIIVNFCRKYINEKGCGHFSPLAAYNAHADRFLLLDVARYKYPPVWVKTSELYKAISTGLDSVSHKSRGFLIISK